jgi:hypothetical protein
MRSRGNVVAEEPKAPAGPENFELQLFALWHKEFKGESDRAAVILGAAKLDLVLRELLVRKFLPSPSGQDELFDTDKPISTFSARINVAYRLGLIDRQFARMLHLVRRIRNDFAHEAVGAELRSGSHRDRVKELAAPYLKNKHFEAFASKFFPGLDHASQCFRSVLTILVVRLDGATENLSSVEDKDAYDIMPPSWLEK